MGLSAGKIAQVMFEKAKETFEYPMQMVDLVSLDTPNAEDMVNADNVIWYPIQQSRPDLTGFDLTGQEQGIIEETYPAVLGDPHGDLTKQRADKMRTLRFWERAGEASGRTQGTVLNKAISDAIITQGSLFYRSNVTSGYEFIAEAQAIMNERQAHHTQRCFILNDRDQLTFSKDLAARQTLQGRPENDAWSKGQIGSNVAEFDVFTGSFLSNITGGADPGRTITGNQSFAPSGGSVNATTKVVTNVDYREASLVVSSSTSLSVGDKFQLENSAVAVQSVGLGDKTASNQPMTFTIIEITDSTHIKVFPKPIAPDDTALTTLEAAYNNINTQILASATLTRLNTDASKKANIFFDKSAIEVIGGTIPAELFQEFDGMKVIHDTMSNGLEMYMIYDGNMIEMNFRYRLFVWYGITVCNPSNCGVAVSY
jgi:hypothetical protein